MRKAEEDLFFKIFGHNGIDLPDDHPKIVDKKSEKTIMKKIKQFSYRQARLRGFNKKQR